MPMADDRWATQREPDIAAELSAAGFDDAVEIGRGGFGVVYRCLHEAVDRTVAVKVLTTDLDHENLARFVREQRAMGRMSGHPNIVDLYQVGVTRSNRPFLVMPYHEHGSLDAQIRSTGPIGWEPTVRLGIKIAGALETAHRVGTLHRDVKPANILLTEYDEPQLTDFGIARVSGGFETASGSITGSPAFTAPEVLEGRPPTAASDVYSLGSTLFCALTGHAAFERLSGEQVVAQFLRISSQPIPDLRESGIPEDVCATLERAMARAVENRFDSAADFGNELRAVERRHHIAVDRMQVPPQRSPLPDRGAESTGTAQWRPPDAAPRSRPRPYRVQAPRTPPSPLTKFRPPTTSRKLVWRHRLLDTLRAGQGRRLTLVHGPAGFGKSSLVAQWREELVSQGVSVAWLTVDRDDDNVVWFLSHLVEAIQRVRAELVGDLGQSLEEQGQATERFVLTSLINRLHESGEPLVAVIDDWHRVSAPESIAVMEFLLDNACHHLQIIVASRTRSGLPLSRMRVRDELLEIDSAALGFDSSESRQFFTDRMQIPPADSDVEELRASTDGWIAALQLASLSLRESEGQETLLGQLRAGTDALGEYLAENVLDALEPDFLDFVLATAVPDRVCGELASALTGVPDGTAKLDQVVARDLFLTRTVEDRRWYRYHHLFAQILRQRLERDHPDRIAALHRRAAAWFRERHLLGEALDHTLAAGDRTAAVRLLENDSLYLLDRSQMSTLLGLIAKLPPDLVLSSPRLQLTIGWANTELQQLDVATKARHRTLELLNTLDLPDDQLAQLKVEADVLQADTTITADRAAGVKDLVAHCLAHAHEHHPFVVSMAALIDTIVDTYEFRFSDAYDRQVWATPYHQKATGPYAVAYGYCFAGMARAEQLDIAGASELYHRAFNLVRDAGNTQSQHARLTRVLLAEDLYQQNRIDEAEELLDETSDAAALGGASDFMIRHYCASARIRSIRGDHDGAVSRLDEGIRTANKYSLPRLRAAVDCERARLGYPPRSGVVSLTRRSRQEPADGIERVTAEMENEATILLMLRSGDPEQLSLACDLAENWVQALAGTGRELARLGATRLLAACLWAAGRKEEAQQTLIPVVAQCERHGLIRFLLDGGPHVVSVLKAVREQLHEGGAAMHPDVLLPFIDTVLHSALTHP
jgi:serine/threonine-protein kinase PknK|nr:serine/threonine-protein kinase [Rhodococcus sp. MSC1_016]